MSPQRINTGEKSMNEENSILLESADSIREKFLKPLESDVFKKRLNVESQNRNRPDGEYQRDYTRILYASSFRRL